MLLLGLLYAVAASISIGLTREFSGIALLWPCNALVFALLLEKRSDIQTVGLGAVYLIGVLINSFFGASSPLAFGLALANCTEIALAILAGQVIFHKSISFDRVKTVFGFLIFVCVIPATVSALLAAWMIQVAQDVSFQQTALSWFLSDFCGMQIVAPLVLMRANYAEIRSKKKISAMIEISVVAAISFVASYLVFTQKVAPLLFFIMPISILSILQLGSFGVFVSIAMAAIAAAISISNHSFFVAEQFHFTTGSQLILVQLLLSSISVGCLPMATMVSALRQLNRRLELQRDELSFAKKNAEEAANAKSQFLSNMSHELRTPMNAVIGFAQLLQFERNGTLSVAQKEYVDQILYSGKHLLDLINDILDFSKSEAGRLSISIEPVDAALLLDDLKGLLVPLAEKHKVMIEVDQNGMGLPSVLADRTRLFQVLLNLCSNGIKYNKPGGSIRIMSQLVSDGEMLRIEIKDTGIGIPESRKGEMFVAFNRLGQDQTSIEGTGIGLVLSAKLVQAMQGRIGFISQEGEGSTFWIEIPVARSKIRSLDFSTHPIAPADIEGLAGKAILYIEDNPGNRQLMESLFQSIPDARLILANNANDALDIVKKRRFDLVISDIHLPGMNGYELFTELRRMPNLSEAPILALSADAEPHHIQKALARGFTDYICKPFDINQLLVTLNKYLAPEKSAL